MQVLYKENTAGSKSLAGTLDAIIDINDFTLTLIYIYRISYF